MPILTNQKHEHFASLVAKGVDREQAYIDAGFSENGARTSSHRLLQRDDIQSRVNEIKNKLLDKVQEKAAVDKAWVIDQLIENVKLGKCETVDEETGKVRVPNLPAANKALELIGKELGMFIDRKEIRTGPLQDLPDDQLDVVIRDAAKTAGITLQ